MTTYEDEELDELMASVKEVVRHNNQLRGELKAAVESKFIQRVIEVMGRIMRTAIQFGKWLASDVVIGFTEELVKHWLGW